MEVENEVDGIRMETLVHTGTLDKPSTTYTPNADIIFKQPLNIQRLHVNAEINDKSFDELFGHLILFVRQLPVKINLINLFYCINYTFF